LNMGYEGVKYKTAFLTDVLPADARIDELRHWCELFHKNGLAPFYNGGTHGNMSFRKFPGKDELVVTAARSSFADYMPDDSFFAIHDADYSTMTLTCSGSKNREPSSEALLHFAIYQQRPDVHAILHGHCATITQHADQMGIPVTREVVESGTMKIVHSVIAVLDQHDFIEIRDHGFLAMGRSIEEAGKLAMDMLEEGELRVMGFG
jgi:ribulose-5-phosphate 4-epimerase/fuculose-1-phosphate aldolase